MKNRNGWRKSTHCNPEGDCVELAPSESGTVGIRDSKAPALAPTLELTPTEWNALLHATRDQPRT